MFSDGKVLTYDNSSLIDFSAVNLVDSENVGEKNALGWVLLQFFSSSVRNFMEIFFHMAFHRRCQPCNNEFFTNSSSHQIREIPAECDGPGTNSEPGLFSAVEELSTSGRQEAVDHSF